MTATAVVASAALPLQSGGFLWYALVFLVLALLAGVAGFRGVAGVSMNVAKLFALIFLVLFLVSAFL